MVVFRREANLSKISNGKRGSAATCGETGEPQERPEGREQSSTPTTAISSPSPSTHLTQTLAALQPGTPPLLDLQWKHLPAPAASHTFLKTPLRPQHLAEDISESAPPRATSEAPPTRFHTQKLLLHDILSNSIYRAQQPPRTPSCPSSLQASSPCGRIHLQEGGSRSPGRATPPPGLLKEGTDPGPPHSTSDSTNGLLLVLASGASSKVQLKFRAR